jgi:hypothetical protein
MNAEVPLHFVLRKSPRTFLRFGNDKMGFAVCIISLQNKSRQVETPDGHKALQT